MRPGAGWGGVRHGGVGPGRGRAGWGISRGWAMRTVLWGHVTRHNACALHVQEHREECFSKDCAFACDGIRVACTCILRPVRS